MDKETIILKVNAGEHLTPEEEFFYLTKIRGFTDLKANTMLTIAANNDPNIIID